MKIAIQHEFLNVDAEGGVAGHDAGATLIRRLLRVFPGAELIGAQPRRYPSFEVLPLTAIDADNTILINMDVFGSVTAWRTLKQLTDKPKIMNFVWWETSRYTDTVDSAQLALSCALFPTFANSERTVKAIEESIRRLTVKPLAERAVVGGVNLGIRLEHVQPRQEPEVPIVLYPAIYVSSRKNPNLFIDVVSRVAKKTPIRVEARLSEAHLVTEPAMRLSRERWAKVGPLLPARDDYWHALARTTAFLATAEEESYGLEYVEALLSGAIGVFPDKEWARALVPESYPYFYSTPSEAEALLTRAVTETATCRAELDAAAGGSFSNWLQDHHDDDNFESAIVEHVNRWFGSVEAHLPEKKPRR